MPSFIILNADDVSRVAGESVSGHALYPVPLADGVRFALPLVVLDDPAHEAKREFLSTLPIAEVGPDDWPPYPGDPA